MTLNVPTTLVSDMANATSQTYDAIWPMVALAVSVPLAFYIIRRLLGLFPRR